MDISINTSFSVWNHGWKKHNVMWPKAGLSPESIYGNLFLHILGATTYVLFSCIAIASLVSFADLISFYVGFWGPVLPRGRHLVANWWHYPFNLQRKRSGYWTALWAVDTPPLPNSQLNQIDRQLVASYWHYHTGLWRPLISNSSSQSS